MDPVPHQTRRSFVKQLEYNWQTEQILICALIASQIRHLRSRAQQIFVSRRTLVLSSRGRDEGSGGQSFITRLSLKGDRNLKNIKKERKKLSCRIIKIFKKVHDVGATTDTAPVTHWTTRFSALEHPTLWTPAFAYCGAASRCN